MKNLLGVGLGLLICGLVNANPIADNPVFKQFAGEWTGEGELIDKDGNKTVVKETWTGKFTESGNFVMSGVRKLDLAEHDFAWEFFANDDIIEGQMKMSDPEVDQRFEVTVVGVTRTMQIKIPFGGGSTMTVVNTVSEDGKTITGTVKIEDENGETTTTGEVKHTKKEA